MQAILHRKRVRTTLLRLEWVGGLTPKVPLLPTPLPPPPLTSQSGVSTATAAVASERRHRHLVRGNAMTTECLETVDQHHPTPDALRPRLDLPPQLAVRGEFVHRLAILDEVAKDCLQKDSEKSELILNFVYVMLDRTCVARFTIFYLSDIR